MVSILSSAAPAAEDHLWLLFFSTPPPTAAVSGSETRKKETPYRPAGGSCGHAVVTWKQLNVIYILLKPECNTPHGRQRSVVIHPCWKTAWFGIQEHRTNRQSRGGAHPVQTRTAEDWSARTDNEDRLHTEERWTCGGCAAG